MLDAIAPLAGLTPAMSPAEQRLLREAAAGAASAVEFGCGGSTGLLLQEVLGPVVSVESDPRWLSRLRGEPDCVEAAASGRWHGLHADLGPVGAWGWPRDAARRADGTVYWNAPWSLSPAPAFVLVDGRYRVACALAALQRLAPEGIVAVHDFWGREHYRPLLDFAELIGTTASLVLLAPKRGVELPDPAAFSGDAR
ncbi:hypothetical protein [Roseococcus pinisoli]|uniref:Class I SAM-dependent methyltransferase n=1 Tax=Roseococcus pinisoli TaxID=2835040 RepID=A0ABS5QEL4_9PROT|nr:hypothetical protein [Roseococcus pinisoli]MBS7811370.1 hypothetical protein [Roseococcus pinisoli]